MLHSKDRSMRSCGVTPLLYGSVPLSVKDTLVIRASLDGFDALLHDLLGDSYEGTRPLLANLQLRISKRVDISGLILAIGYWSDRLIASVGQTDFKGQLPSDGIARVYSAIVGRHVVAFERALKAFNRVRTDVYSHDQHWIPSLVDAWSLARQVTCFLTKLDVDAFWAADQALEDYLDGLRRVEGSFYAPDDPTVIAAAKVLRRWLNGIDFTDLHPKHGTGSVAEGSLTSIEKDLRLHSMQAIDYLLRKSGATTADYRPTGWLMDGNDYHRCSRLIFVPKTIRKLRTICAEPAILQYFQQAVMRKIEDFGRATGLTRFFDCRNQERNQILARIGSDPYIPGVNHHYATIDLSAASDSVSWSLVKALFRGTDLYPWLIATRSRSVQLPNGVKIGLPIFAPMGSALCFPIESLVFAAICETVVEETGYTVISSDTFVVYGDDIIVPCCLAARVIEKLRHLGFTVNPKKTFISGPFRESCGGEYLFGYDTTPIYFTLSEAGGGVTPSTYSALISAANTAAFSGFWRLRTYYVRMLTRNAARKVFPPFSLEVRGGYILSANPTNYRLKRRWNADLQRGEIKILTTTSWCESLPPGPLTDARGYLEYQLSAEYRNKSSMYPVDPRVDQWTVIDGAGVSADQYGQTRERYRAKWVDPI